VAALFTPHPLVLETAYSEVKQRAFEQTMLLVGTPGSVGSREVNGSRFLYRQFYDAAGKKVADYLGPEGDPEAEARAAAVREAQTATQALLQHARLLSSAGYVRADTASVAVLVALAQAGAFRAGAVLVGSHAYGVALNELGVRAAAFRTGDVDVARPHRLALDARLEELLERARLALSPVPGLDRKAPPTSYRAPGRDGLRVDLLMPAAGSEVVVRRVPELDAHATALPHLAYLLEAPIDAVVLGRESVVPLKIPRPERLAWHKMLVSGMRAETSDKRGKDLHQAAVLVAALVEREPDALREAFEELRPKPRVRRAAGAVRALLEKAGHARAVEGLDALVSR
jgi:hypothetical protein